MRRKKGSAVLLVIREPNSKGRTPSEWLRGSTPWDEVEEEAMSILTDPRDTVKRVEVWNDHYQQFDSRVFRREA